MKYVINFSWRKSLTELSTSTVSTSHSLQYYRCSINSFCTLGRETAKQPIYVQQARSSKINYFRDIVIKKNTLHRSIRKSVTTTATSNPLKI